MHGKRSLCILSDLITAIVSVLMLWKEKNSHSHWGIGGPSKYSRFNLAGEKAKAESEYIFQSEGQATLSGNSSVLPLVSGLCVLVLPLHTHGIIWGDLFPEIGGGFLRNNLYPQFSLLKLDARMCIKVHLPTKLRSLLGKKIGMPCAYSAGKAGHGSWELTEAYSGGLLFSEFLLLFL